MADGFLSGLARRAHDWREEAEDSARPYASRARRGGRDAMGELRGLWSRIEELVEDRVAPAASSAGETASDYARSAGKVAGRYARAARDYAPQARETAEHAADYVRDATRARPLLAIGIAIGATWLIASMLGSSRRR